MIMSEQKNGTKGRVKSKDAGRSAGLDIVRSAAVFFVVSVHFFYNNGYYSQELEGVNMFLMTAMRWLFYSCVPLFLILSGFLMNRKKPDKAYYMKIFRILGEYLMACILCNLFKTVCQDKELDFAGWIYSILDFSAAPYSWYVSMYTGLFLLIPFLNKAYGGPEVPKKHKQILLLSMLFITALPGIINYEHSYLPAWWPRLYPFTYYFIGCYLAEFRLKPAKWKCALGIAALSFGQAAVSFMTVTDKNKFNWNFPSGYGALPTVGIAVLVFLMLYRIEIHNWLVKKIFFVVSACSLSIYLLSWIADQIIYKQFNQKVAFIPDKLGWYFVIVPLVFASTLIPAYLCHKLVNIPGIALKQSHKQQR